MDKVERGRGRERERGGGGENTLTRISGDNLFLPKLASQ